MLHPVAPFITEELWHLLGYGAEKDFIQSHGTGSGGDLLKVLRDHGVKMMASKVADVGLLREFVAAVRAAKASSNQANKRDSVVTVVAKDTVAQALLQHNLDKVSRLAGLAELKFAADIGGRPGTLTTIGTLVLEVAEGLDVGAEKVRLTKELEKIEKAVSAGEAKLSNETFVSKAPPQILEGARKQLNEAKAKRDELARMLASLG